MEIEVLAIELEQEPIELCKLLKIANLVSGGGEAKMVISEGYVHLNGEVEYQKRKKIYFEDIVQFNGEAIMAVKAELLTIDDTPKASNESSYAEQENVSSSYTKKPERQANLKKSKQTKNNHKSTNKHKNSVDKAKKKPSENNPRTGRKSISF